MAGHGGHSRDRQEVSSDGGLHARSEVQGQDVGDRVCSDAGQRSPGRNEVRVLIPGNATLQLQPGSAPDAKASMVRESNSTPKHWAFRLPNPTDIFSAVTSTQPSGLSRL